MSKRGEVLVAIMNDWRDFAIAQEQGWYRIPVSSAAKWLNDCWPPSWLAFYMTQTFGPEAHAVRYYGRVYHIRIVSRRELFPKEPKHAKSDRLYHQVFFEPLQELTRPILSRRRRRIVFIPTTWHKFAHAVEINDLYTGSPRQDRLWAALQRQRITAEREFLLQVGRQTFTLDFAICCARGHIDVETDGDTVHAHPEKGTAAGERSSALEAAGWSVLRFTTQQINEELESYTLPRIAETINRQGGLSEGKPLPRRIDLNPDGSYQPSLFDEW